MLLNKRFRILNAGLVMAAALVAALAFAGCGGDDSGDERSGDERSGDEPVKEPKTWTLADTLPSTGNFSNVAYGKDVFVAATNAKEIIWSADGKTWQLAEAGYADIMNTGANYVFFGNNEFILAGRDNPGTQWAKSTDGKTWTAVTGLGVRAAGGGAYGNGAWVLGSNGHNVLVKADSGDWATKDTGIADPNINWVNGVAFGKGTFVITGMNGRIAWSGDTLAWTDVSPLDSSNEPLFGTGAVNSVVFGNERFVAVGGSPNIAVTSTDGKTWTQTGSIGIITERDFLYAGFGGGVFLAGHQNGGWSYSTDAEKWTAIPSVPLEGSTGIAYGNGQFVMVGGAKIAWSTPE